jgi:HEAT repeat protein
MKWVFRKILLVGSILFSMILPTCAQEVQSRAWSILEGDLAQKASSERLAAVRVLALLPGDRRAARLARRALKDPSALVRAAAATSLGQMHATESDADLKQALNDGQLSVVMAAAHALRLLNDPACYEAYYAIYTGERKDDSGMIAQEMKVLHDPKQVAEMGFNEGIGYLPFASIGWEALQTIMKDRKNGAAARAALISALATDPDRRTGAMLLDASENPNWVIRVAALEAIAKREDSSLLPKLASRMADSRHEARDAAAATIIRLSDVSEVRAEKSPKPVTAPQWAESRVASPSNPTEQ